MVARPAQFGLLDLRRAAVRATGRPGCGRSRRSFEQRPIGHSGYPYRHVSLGLQQARTSTLKLSFTIRQAAESRLRFKGPLTGHNSAVNGPQPALAQAAAGCSFRKNDHAGA